MPSNSVISITNYVTVTSGSLPASPVVTATLRYGSTLVAHLTNAAYNNSSNWIVWSGTLSGNVTVPSGQQLALTITNNEATAQFRIDYDSATKPSKIALPTTTVINIDSFSVFDAPYPGGNVVTAPTAGSLLYVRATVSDPFGAYDITSLGLFIDGAGTADDISTNLNNAHLVATNSCSKTYEFTWQTGVNPGGFNLSATANEGTEGITDTATASLTLTFLDLGTPSTTVFTSGNNGPATNAFAPNASICVRVTDSDQNTNAATIETLSVIVTSSTGDSETLLLTETSANSGIFTACLTASASGGGGTNNGVLNAPAGSVLNVNYTDPNDPGDTSAATGSVLTPPGVPGLGVTKSLVAPTDGQAGVGEAVQFSIQVINTGSTTLTNVAVTDNFPSANLTFVSASVTPNIIGGSSVTWTNLGTFLPGQGVTLLVNFTASAVAASAVNSASGSALGGTTNFSTAGVTITRSALTIAKSLVNPTNGPVPIGSNIVFRIAITNSGTVAITNLPLEDTFSGAQLQFVSATITPISAYGSLLWTNLASGGALAPGNSITIDVTMKVVGSGNPSINTAKADYAVDAFGDPVPSATDSVGITTGAARITGNVYNDIDKSGTLTAGDTGLAGVTIELYSDPNGDGNPADGTLLRIVTTGATGDYELLNLTTGRYVVVETDLPGYASSFPLNNRLALNITGLTTNASNHFFDYIPAVTNYATITGKVWSDTNASGTIDVGESGLGGVTVELIQDVNTNGVADLGEPSVASTATDTNGVFAFYSVVPGSYVVVKTDLFGHVSTGDSQGTNDNMIGLTLGNGAVSTNNYFLDYFTGNYPGNDAPVANPASYTVGEETPLPITLIGSDVDGPVTNFVVVTPPLHGTLTGSGANRTYTSTNNYFGPDSFTFTVNDGSLTSAVATITITVTNINDAPVATNLVVITPQDTATNLTLLGGDLESPVTFTALTGPTNGAIGPVNPTTGAVTYTPTNGYSGPDSFTFRVSDGSLFATGTVSITVTPAIVPIADVALFKTGPASGVAGANLTFNLTVTNLGTSTASNVVVADQLPAGLTVFSTTPGAAVSNNLVTWPSFSLASGAASNFTVTVRAAEGGTYTNIAFSTSPTVDPNPTNNNGSSTNSQVVTTVTPSADVAVTKTGAGTVLATDSLVYTLIVTNRGPSTATNVIVRDTLPAGALLTGASGSFTESNGVVTWAALTLSNGGTASFTVTVTPPLSGTLTNIASGTSGTPDPDPSNHDGSSTNSRVTTIVTPVADLSVIKTGPPVVTNGVTFSYAITVTNQGPSAAINVVVTDLLPTNLTYSGSSPTGVFASNTVTWPTIPSLPAGGVTNFTITVVAPASGTFTNVASAVADTLDTDSSNNSGVSASSQATTTVVSPAQFRLLQGPNVFNPQTGLFEQRVTVTNTGGTTAAALRLLVGDIRSTNGTPRTNVFLWNATGTNVDQRRYVQYNAPLDPGSNVTIILEFYNPLRTPFTNSLEVQLTLPTPATTNSGTGLEITRVFLDSHIPGDPRPVIEFPTVPGHHYTIIYTDDLVTWRTATPSVTANANSTQWYDDGPPKTISKPAHRTYRVIANP